MDSGTESYLRFLQGDDGGLAEIIRTYKDGLILYLYGYVKDIGVAEELAEDTFVKLVVKRPRFSPRYSFKTWLYTIGRNGAINFLRRSKRQEVPLEDLPHLRDEAQDLERAYLQEEKRILLHHAMEQLKQDYRQVLWLTYFEGFSYQQIGRIMKKTTHSVETLAYRARLALKQILIKEGFDYENL